MIPLHKLQTKWSWYSNQQDRLLASPIVHARANTTLKVMEAICTPHHDCSPNYFLKWTLGRVAIFTNPQIYSYLEWATRGCVDEPKCNSQFLTVVTQMKHLSLFFHIMQRKFSIYGTEHRSLMSPDNLFSSARISLIWGWSWLSSTNVCTLIIHFDPVQPGFLFTPLSFLCHSTFQQHRCLISST
jgi:hypothetical protein